MVKNINIPFPIPSRRKIRISLLAGEGEEIFFLFAGKINFLGWFSDLNSFFHCSVDVKRCGLMNLHF